MMIFSRILPTMIAFTLVLLFLMNYGGGEGGYSQLPACNSSHWGQTLAVQGKIWKCPVGGDHWVIVG